MATTTITDQLIVEQHDGVGRLRLNQPEKRNAISYDMWVGIGAVMRRFAGDEQVRVVVVSGQGGRAFSAGADISQFESQRDTLDAIARYNAAITDAHRELTEIAKPTIAEIEGYCMGGGLATALCCDLRLAGDDAVFGIPAARLGVGYGYAGLRPLVDLVGPALAKEILFTGRKFDAREAYDMGLVNRIVPRADLTGEVAELAATLAGNAPLTIRACKRIVAEIGKDPADRALALCQQLVDECYASEDYKEGRRAFMEKRKPEFKGR